MSEELPPELQRRIRSLENPAEQGRDFDRVSWAWLILLGVVTPVLLLLWGWSS